ncbi:hypothetical protein NGCG_00747 [Neisseria gonorrhoeae DGI18]|nr:hypothetical protein NGCG_00747 [Neisseria gonorrhoeae DGI18]
MSAWICLILRRYAWDYPYMRIFACIFVANLPAAVRRTVIDQNHFIIGKIFGKHGIHAAAKVFFHIVNRDDDRENHKYQYVVLRCLRVCLKPALAMRLHPHPAT